MVSAWAIRVVVAKVLASDSNSSSSSQSCSDYCTSKFGAQSIGYVQGTAPFCSGDCYDCNRHPDDICGPEGSDFSDGGHSCWSGSKQCCCSNTAVVELAEKRVDMEVAESAPSCDAYCTSHGIKYGYVRGTAPFCGAGPSDCCAHDFPGMQASEFSDGGSSCWSGSKICCCGTPAGQTGCPKPGPSDLSCNIVKPVCKAIVNKAITSVVECTELSAEGAGICEAVGLGPEDPWADACAALVAGAIETACTTAVKQGGQFGSNQCIGAAGCSTSTAFSNNVSMAVVA